MRLIAGVLVRVRRIGREIARRVVRLMAVRPWSRGLLNAMYRRLSANQRGYWHRRFAKLFRERPHPGVCGGKWRVDFAGREIVVPLVADRYWLDWDTALSVVGHDLEVKETYGAILQSPQRPELFVDIGGNYGTHSLLFLVSRIPAITVEPNPSCHRFFRELCASNRVEPRLEPVAIGAVPGHVDLSYPERDTWLGATNAETTSKLLAGQQALVTVRVKQRTVDDYLADMGAARTLLKIDTEGNELAVLQGATRTLRVVRPTIVFECDPDACRAEIFALLAAVNYAIHLLPWSPAGSASPLTQEQFVASQFDNFVAVPQAV